MHDGTTTLAPEAAYRTLGVRRGCGVDAVRAAFRRAVVLVHPDTAPAGRHDPRAVGGLKRARDVCLAIEAGDSDGSTAMDRIDAILREHGRSRAFPGDPRLLPRNGGDVHVHLRVTETPGPGERLVVPGLGRSCRTCSGRGTTTTDLRKACGVCEGRGWWSRTLGRTTLRVECVGCRGEGTVLDASPCPTCRGVGKSDAPLVVRVPRGWRSERAMRIVGGGRVGINGGAPGDALLRIVVSPGVGVGPGDVPARDERPKSLQGDLLERSARRRARRSDRVDLVGREPAREGRAADAPRMGGFAPWLRDVLRRATRKVLPRDPQREVEAASGPTPPDAGPDEFLDGGAPVPDEIHPTGVKVRGGVERDLLPPFPARRASSRPRVGAHASAPSRSSS